MTRPPSVSVVGLCRTFVTRQERVPALQDVSFTVHEGAFVTLLGPSGSGKTTALRSIAGLERPDYGRIELGGRVVHSSEDGIEVPTEQRNIGMVFQSYAVWPHMTVAGNVAYPLRARRTPRGLVGPLVEEALTIVGLEGLGRRRATALSGGQQQRVALARAIVGRPALLLLDEPLSSIDAPLRNTLQLEIRSIQRELGIATISVTHDQREAMRMSDDIVVMRAGMVAQQGRPRQLYFNPVDSGVARMLGPTSIIVAELLEPIGGGLLTLRAPFGTIVARAGRPIGRDARAVHVSIRPEAVRIIPRASPFSEGGATSGVVADIAFVGSNTELDVDVRGARLKVRSRDVADLEVGDEIGLLFDPSGCVVLESATDLRDQQ